MTINFAVLIMVWVGERIWLSKAEIVKVVVMDDLDLVKPENYDRLLLELQNRLGVEINRIQVGRIDYLKNQVKIKVFIKKQEHLTYLEGDDTDGNNSDS